MILILITEVSIAFFVKDNFVRPYLGDVLVVALLYCLIKAFFKWHINLATIIVLLFAFLVEFLQSINIIGILGLDNFKLARIIIGTSFSWLDILAYVGGAFMVLIFEKAASRKIVTVT